MIHGSGLTKSVMGDQLRKLESSTKKDDQKLYEAAREQGPDDTFVKWICIMLAKRLLK